jgi:ubiquitin-protein ligase
MQSEKRQRINKVILQEFQETNFQSFSDDQITITFPREYDLRHVEIVLTPTEGPYAGGKFEFALTLPPDYPHQPATVQCTTQIMHPNISPQNGKVCFNVFSGTANAFTSKNDRHSP